VTVVELRQRRVVARGNPLQQGEIVGHGRGHSERPDGVTRGNGAASRDTFGGTRAGLPYLS
jgi:hypothetical protein